MCAMADGAALIAAGATIAGVIVGGGLQVIQQSLAARARREELATERLWAARREAYAAFLIALNQAAHIAGNLAPRPGRIAPTGAQAREDADYFYDRTVMPALRALEVVATPEATMLAKEAAVAVGAFRERMTHPESPPPAYRSDEYNAAYSPAQEARDRFADQAVRELAGP